MSLMVSISGIRAIVDESLTPDVVVKYAAAFAEYCNRGTIIIGRDAIVGIGLFLQLLSDFGGKTSELKNGKNKQ